MSERSDLIGDLVELAIKRKPNQPLAAAVSLVQAGAFLTSMHIEDFTKEEFMAVVSREFDRMAELHEKTEEGQKGDPSPSIH